MSHGLYKVYTVTMASGGTLSSECDLGRGYENVYLEIPSMTSNSQHYIQVASVTGGTYRRVCHPAINSSTVGINDLAIHSAATSRLVPIPNGFQFYKIETTATCDSGEVYRILAGD